MTDILLENTDGDLQDLEIDLATGDFVVGDSESQHVYLLIDTSKTDWTQNVETGVGSKKWINGRLDAKFEREVNLQLEADGLTDLRIDIVNDSIYINRK